MQSRLLALANVWRRAVHGARDDKAQSSTSRFHSSGAPGNPYAPARARSRAIQGESVSAADSRRLNINRPASPKFPSRKASSSGPTARGFARRPAGPVHRGRRQAPPAAEPPRNADCPAAPTGSTRSPRPRQTAGPAAKNSGTSLPSSAPSSCQLEPSTSPAPSPRWLRPTRRRRRWSHPPAPRPSESASPAAGCAPWATPARWRSNSTARTTRFSGPSGRSSSQAPAPPHAPDAFTAGETDLLPRLPRGNTGYRTDSIGATSVSIS